MTEPSARPDLRGAVLDARLQAMGTSMQTLMSCSMLTRTAIEKIVATVPMTEKTAKVLDRFTRIPAKTWTWMTMDDYAFDLHLLNQKHKIPDDSDRWGN